MNNRIKLIAIVFITCVISACTEAKKVPIETHFYAPNTFSPDGDGLNELFFVKPIYGFVIKDFHMSVYDQSLQLTFQSDDLLKGWDGKINGIDAPQGYYDYQLIYSASQLLDSTSTDTVFSEYQSSSNINLFRE